MNNEEKLTEELLDFFCEDNHQLRDELDEDLTQDYYDDNDDDN